jgi:hypothetical protein
MMRPFSTTEGASMKKGPRALTPASPQVLLPCRRGFFLSLSPPPETGVRFPCGAPVLGRHSVAVPTFSDEPYRGFSAARGATLLEPI